MAPHPRSLRSSTAALLTCWGALGLGACSQGIPNLPLQSGQLLDAPVVNAEYGDGDRTDEDGFFEYHLGATLVFRIGGIELGPPVRVTTFGRPPRITPVDIFGVPTENHPYVTNLARFLQTIDLDENLDNGIQIAEGLHTVSEERALDFRVTNTAMFETEAQAILDAYAPVLGEVRTLVSADDALAHLVTSLRGKLCGRYAGTFETIAGFGTVPTSGVLEFFITRSGEVCGWLLENGDTFEEALGGTTTTGGSTTFSVPTQLRMFSGPIADRRIEGSFNDGDTEFGTFKVVSTDAFDPFLGVDHLAFVGAYSGAPAPSAMGEEEITISVGANGDLSLDDPRACGTILFIDEDGARFGMVSEDGDLLEGTILRSGVMSVRATSRDGVVRFRLTRP